MLAGLLYDHLGSYRLPFLLAGVPPVVCSVLMFAVRCVPDDAKEDEDLMEKSASLQPVAEKCSNGALRSPASPPHPAPTGTGTGTWVRLLVEEQLCVRVSLLAAPRSPGHLQSYSLLA